jgi:hypothetical protein
METTLLGPTSNFQSTSNSSHWQAPESEQNGAIENCNLQITAAGQYWSSID